MTGVGCKKKCSDRYCVWSTERGAAPRAPLGLAAGAVGGDMGRWEVVADGSHENPGYQGSYCDTAGTINCTSGSPFRGAHHAAFLSHRSLCDRFESRSPCIALGRCSKATIRWTS